MIAPLFFVLLLGIVEAGRFIFYYETLNNATREGARYAIVNGENTLGCPTGTPAPGSTSCDPTGANVVARVRQAAFGVMTGIVVTPSWDPNNGRGSTVRVAATFTYTSLVPLLPLPPINVTAESSLVVNN
ncbi:MAG: pilus assembly protein [Chloroflexi bacterium]|nr:pilus assembly protein [Chloroflexota bacterium]